MSTVKKRGAAPAQPRRCYSRRDVCEMLNVLPKTLLRWIRAGQFPAPRLSPSHRRAYWSHEQIAALFPDKEGG